MARGEQPPNAAALVEQLAGAYSQVLGAPRDVDARIALATLQASVGNSHQVLYQAEKAEEIDPVRAHGSVDLALGKYDAYVRLGQPQNAAAEQEKIKVVDPSRFNQLQDGARFRQLRQVAPPAPETRPNPAAIRVQ
jgi:hypothetical protein